LSDYNAKNKTANAAALLEARHYKRKNSCKSLQS